MEYFGYPAIKPECFPGGLEAEYFDNKNLSGSPKFIGTDKEINFDWKDNPPRGLTGESFSVRWTGKLVSPVTGKFRISATFDDGARVYLNGRLIINNWNNGTRRMTDTLLSWEKGQDL